MTGTATAPAFTFSDDVPKTARGRTHTETIEDQGVAALVARGSGAITVPAGDDVEKLRRAWSAAVRRAGRNARTVVSDGTLYVSLK